MSDKSNGYFWFHGKVFHARKIKKGFRMPSIISRTFTYFG